MEILGIGPFELIIILILALAVFGPDKLPEIGAKLGRGMRQMRKATREFSRELEKARQALDPDQQISRPLEEIKEVAKDATALAMAVRDPGQAIRDSVMRELVTPPAEPKKQDAEEETQGTPHPGAEGSAAPAPDVLVPGTNPDVQDETGQTPYPDAEGGSMPGPDVSKATPATDAPAFTTHDLPTREADPSPALTDENNAGIAPEREA